MQHNLWKQALEAAYTSSGRTLKKPLGKWTGPPKQWWWNFYNPKTEQVVIVKALATDPNGIALTS
jgi:hypothetical protein